MKDTHTMLSIYTGYKLEKFSGKITKKLLRTKLGAKGYNSVEY